MQRNVQRRESVTDAGLAPPPAAARFAVIDRAIAYMQKSETHRRIAGNMHRYRAAPARVYVDIYRADGWISPPYDLAAPRHRARQRKGGGGNGKTEKKKWKMEIGK